MARRLTQGPDPSDPGRLTLSPDKVKFFHPGLYGAWGEIKAVLSIIFDNGYDFRRRLFAEALDGGDSRAALVISVDPLRVAAYSDEMDAVAMLRFPQELVEQYGLKRGSKLLTCNLYEGRGRGPVKDLIEGPACTKRFGNMMPYVADFLSDDTKAIERRKKAISEEEWQRCRECAAAYVKKHGETSRDGSPLYCGMPAIRGFFD